MVEDYALVLIAIFAVWIALRFLLPQRAAEGHSKTSPEDSKSTEEFRQNETDESP
ncbi:MAG: hypothetical protein AB4040_04795 [Synechococcus sp.]